MGQKRIEYLKAELVQLKKELKKERKLQKKVVGSGFISWMSNRADNATLRLHEKLVDRVAEIRQKRSDPIGYEADQMVKGAIPIVDMLTKSQEKGKVPGKKQLQLVSQMRIVLSNIVKQHLGYRWEDAADLLSDLDHLAPPVMDNVSNGLLDMVDKLRKEVEQATGEKIEPFNMNDASFSKNLA